MRIVNSEMPGYSSMVKNVFLLAVLTQDDAGLYATYTGIVLIDENHSREDAMAWVAHNGVKETHKRATQYFPLLSARQYRA